MIYFFKGEFLDARIHCERALAECDPERDREARERFGDDISAVVMSVLAVTSWMLGEVERAWHWIDAAARHAIDVGHGVSSVSPLGFGSLLEMLRGEAAAALRSAENLEALARDQDMSFWRIVGELVSGWAQARLGHPVSGAAKMQRALKEYADQGGGINGRYWQALLAEVEAEASGVENALARIDQALTETSNAEYRWDLSLVHRLRGAILLKRHPPDLARAEEAFLTAIAIAREQGARSLGLQAALALAKLYQANGRDLEAHAVLAPALEGFSLTPEMPEILEAQRLLESLA